MGHYYRDLLVWQKAIVLSERVYEVTRNFPRRETYTITDQLRRSAISVPSNIAGGQGRLSPLEFRQFLGTARGSLLELETQLIIARDLGYLNEAQADELLGLSDEVSRLLHGLINAISRIAHTATGNRKLETGNS